MLPKKVLTVLSLPPAPLRENLMFVSSKMRVSDSCVNVLKEISSAGIYTSGATFQSDHNTLSWHSVRKQQWLPYSLYSGCLVLSLLIYNWKTGEPTSWKPTAELRAWLVSAWHLHLGNSPPQPGNKQPGSIWVHVCGCSVQTLMWTERKKMTECPQRWDSAVTLHQPGSIMISALRCKILCPATQRRHEYVHRFTLLVFQWVQRCYKCESSVWWTLHWAAESARHQHKQPCSTHFSISQLKVTTWQEGHAPRGHLTASAKACKSSCPRTNRVRGPGMKSGSLKVGC